MSVKSINRLTAVVLFAGMLVSEEYLIGLLGQGAAPWRLIGSMITLLVATSVAMECLLTEE
jgi:hypothetical protein